MVCCAEDGFIEITEQAAGRIFAVVLPEGWALLERLPVDQGREKDLDFNQALVRHGCVNKKTLLKLAKILPVDDEMKGIILRRIKSDFVAVNPRSAPKSPKQ